MIKKPSPASVFLLPGMSMRFTLAFMLRDPNQRPAEPSSHKFLRYFNLFMTLVYPAFGIYIMLSGPDQISLDARTKIILGAILVFYGIFRFFRTYNRYFRKDRTSRQD